MHNVPKDLHNFPIAVAFNKKAWYNKGNKLYGGARNDYRF